MNSKFAQDVLKELNNFRSNPKSIQHQCELIQKGFSRLRANDPFLKEIGYFIKELESINPLPQLQLNKDLSESARKELPNFRGKETYQKYRKSNFQGIVPDFYLQASPALIADDGADEPINVLTKTLLNKLDKYKEGRSILCDPKFTQVGIAHEVYDDENMIILIFATKKVEEAPQPIRATKRDFLMNIQYHETKDIKKPKYETRVFHRIRGEIFGDDNLNRTFKELYAQGGNTPFLNTRYNSKTTSVIKPRAAVRTPGLGQIQRPKISLISEKTEKSFMKRRNEIMPKITEKKYETKTISTGVRQIPRERKNDYSSQTSKIRSGRFRVNQNNNESYKRIEKFEIPSNQALKRFNRGINNNQIIITKEETTTIEEGGNRFGRRGNNEERGSYKVETSGASIRRKYGRKK